MKIFSKIKGFKKSPQMKERKAEIKDSSPQKLIFVLLKGAIIGVVASVVMILLFALVVKFANINDTGIRIGNIVIRIISVLIAAGYTIKKSKKQGLVKGVLVGLIYSVLAYLAFSLMDLSFKFDITLINDLLIAGIAGGLGGIIFVNSFKIKRRSR